MMGLPQAVKSSSVIGTGILGLVTTAMYDKSVGDLSRIHPEFYRRDCRECSFNRG